MLARRRLSGLLASTSLVRPLATQGGDAGPERGRDAPPPFPPFDPASTAAAFAHTSTGSLLRAWAVLSACRRPLVSHADGLLRTSRRLLGDRATDALLRSTFFAHFCGGEDGAAAAVTTARLAGVGVGSILDYAAEADLPPGDGGEGGEGEPVVPAAAAAVDPAAAAAALPAKAVGRTFPYGSEAACDAHAVTFRAAIAAAAGERGAAPQPGALPGFAALKVSALGDPRLLARTSASLRAIAGLFGAFDGDGDGRVTRPEFETVYASLFSDGTPSRLDDLFAHLDPDGTGAIDLLSWSRRVRLQDVPTIVRACRAPGPLAATALTPEELAGLEAMLGRLRGLAASACDSGVRLFVDAEQAAIQPAIAHAARALQRQFNGHDGPGYPAIFTTVQAYLKNAEAALRLDLRRAAAEEWAWAGKVVRGAYLEHERAAAAASGQPCPVWESRAGTDASYEACAGLAIDAALAGPTAGGIPGPEVMLATHNRASVQAGVDRVTAAGRAPSASTPPPPVYFGQLLGMADGLTFPLATSGWASFKYVPYGPVRETTAYLVRRARENAGALGGAGGDVASIEKELARRLAAALFVPTRVAQRTGGAWK